MADFINTIDVLGDDAVIDSIIDRSITEFKDNVITKIGAYAFSDCAALETVDMPNVTALPHRAFDGCSTLKNANFQNVTSVTERCLVCPNAWVKVPSLTNVGWYGLRECSMFAFECSSKVTFGNNPTPWGNLGHLILRSETMCVAEGSSLPSATDVYVPRALIEDYKAATNWSAYADKFKAIEDYTVDGTATGEFVRCSGVELDKTSLTFDEWKIQTLTATILTPSPFGIDKLKWKSADPSIATVGSGVVCPVSKGTTTITATCNGYSATCEVVSNVERIPMIYQLSEPTTFNGTSDYIDTGIQLFDIAKDFTIICEAEFSKLTDQNKCLFHCMNEASPWPGLSIDGSNGIRICYTGSISLTTTISNRNAVSALAIRYVDGKMNAIRYKNTSGDIVTQTINGTPTYTKVTQNLLLGAYQDTSGTKGRFFNGTINRFEVYPTALSDEQIETFI